MVEKAGSTSLSWYLKHLEASPGTPRSRAAIYHRATKLWGKGGLTRGAQSVRELSRDTGYHPDQINRARRALNLRFDRLSRWRGKCMISFEQAEDVTAWLKHDFWSKKLRVYRCLWCATDSRPHHAAGLCMTCYQSHRRSCRQLGMPHEVRPLYHHLQRRGIPAELLQPLLANLQRGWVPERNRLNNFAPWPRLGLVWGVRGLR